MAREDFRTKGRRYASEGRLHVRLVDPVRKVIDATCRGNGDAYDLGYRRGYWWCSCPARSTCAHLAALQLVTIKPNQP